ncbi:hypothetical protein [Dankookia sp. P2]|uniref:hypothetical protein n=1 Tax=Dankookia sp. P2 TaxID=3423955 RepID=UPI003D6795A0
MDDVSGEGPNFAGKRVDEARLSRVDLPDDGRTQALAARRRCLCHAYIRVEPECLLEFARIHARSPRVEADGGLAHLRDQDLSDPPPRVVRHSLASKVRSGALRLLDERVHRVPKEAPDPVGRHHSVGPNHEPRAGLEKVEADIPEDWEVSEEPSADIMGGLLGNQEQLRECHAKCRRLLVRVEGGGDLMRDLLSQHSRCIRVRDVGRLCTLDNPSDPHPRLELTRGRALP